MKRKAWVALTNVDPLNVPTLAIVLAPVKVMRKLTWSSSLDLPRPWEGISPVPNPDVEILGDTQRMSHTQSILHLASGIPTPIFLTRSGLRTLRKHQVFTLREDWSCLAILTDEALKEELSILLDMWLHTQEGVNCVLHKNLSLKHFLD